MAGRPSLQRRIIAGLFGYMVLLSLAIIGFGFSVHEAAEEHAWRAILRAELDQYLRRSSEDPDYRWSDTETLGLQESAPGDAEARFAGLPVGIHDEVLVDDREHAVLIHEDAQRRIALSLDISAVEERERSQAALILLFAAILIAALAWGAAWLVRRLADPLRKLADAISGLQPETAAARLPLEPGATEELAVVVNALNAYLERNDAFVQREREFIDTASHELRTPIAVIAGASDLALAQQGLSIEIRGQLERIRRTAASVELLLPLLLALAKSPERLARVTDRFELDELLPEIVDDHRHLLGDKSLQVSMAPLPRCVLSAPLIIVQAAIGNLLRNAIENSDSGEIRIDLRAPGVVRIEDPGQRMSPEQISALYARHARGEARYGGGGGSGIGIGLELIARLCGHLGWRLGFEQQPGGGTCATLDLSSSLAR